ncbi:hypothetical protein Tco_1047966 [Tanacetum coccineum]
MMCGEVNKSEDKLGETLHVDVIIDCATLQSSPPTNAIDYQDPQPTNKGSAGFDDMLDPGSKDHLLNDTVPKGLVKPFDMMYGVDNISDDRLDDTIAGGVIDDRSTIQESPPPNAMEYQEPEPTNKGSIGFDDIMDPGCKDQPVNDNVSKGLVKLVDTMSGEDNISNYNLDETVAGGVIVECATLQEPNQTDKVEAAVFVDVQLDRVQSLKNPSLIDNVEVSFIIPFK